jgi:predicted RNase H-like nuclease (RuvC/YqgF family)
MYVLQEVILVKIKLIKSKSPHGRRQELHEIDIVEKCEIILDRIEHEQRSSQVDRLKSEIPKLKAELNDLESRQHEAETDLKWMEGRVDELVNRNRELLAILRGSSQ